MDDGDACGGDDQDVMMRLVVVVMIMVSLQD
jgi:hypothetical protein